MNLKFEDYADQGEYILQRAIVTKCKEFWIWWKHPNNLNLKKYVTLRKELISGCSNWVAYRLYPKNASLPYPEMNKEYSLRNVSNLRPYQYSAVETLCAAMLRYGSALDSSDAGIGKTYTAVAVARELNLRPGIVCKKIAISSWEAVCKEMGVKPLFVASWERAKSRSKCTLQFIKYGFDYRTVDRGGSKMYRWSLPQRSILIFDEAHMGNNYTKKEVRVASKYKTNEEFTMNSQILLAAERLPVLCLSATIAHNMYRMRVILHILKIIHKDKFIPWIESIGCIENQHEKYENLSEFSELTKINKIIYPYHGVRLSYKDPLVKAYFPEEINIVKLINLAVKEESKQNILYKDLLYLAKHYEKLGRKASEVREANLRFRQECELLKADSLSELAASYIEQGNSVVIFVNFLNTLKYLARKFKTKSIIHGGQTGDKGSLERDMVIKNFQDNKSHILISMIAAGGQSISLHDLKGRRRISLICPTYNPVHLKQTMGRIYRSGSLSIPINFLVYAAGTIEQQVAAKVNYKIKAIDTINTGDLIDEDIFKVIEGKSIFKTKRQFLKRRADNNEFSY